ncbi:Protein of unknown function [Gryllus bimaculatus]|nr:Protein of unknown function [Gryllus bimaculatus]
MPHFIHLPGTGALKAFIPCVCRDTACDGHRKRQGDGAGSQPKRRCLAGASKRNKGGPAWPAHAPPCRPAHQPLAQRPRLDQRPRAARRRRRRRGLRNARDPSPASGGRRVRAAAVAAAATTIADGRWHAVPDVLSRIVGKLSGKTGT